MRRKLIKGPAIISMDSAIGDLRTGDVLIEQDRIVAVAPSIAADDADVIDASHMLLLPGLINGHLHTWQTGLRGLAADWTVAEYMQAMHRGLATLFRPEDIYIANLMGALNQINNGATTLVDWCHNNPTTEHSDAAIRALDDAGIRALFLHGSPKPDPKPGQRHFSEVPMPRREIERFCKGRFASRDGLVTFGLAILGPYYSTYDVHAGGLGAGARVRTAGQYACGRRKGACTATDLSGCWMTNLVDDHLTVVHGNDIARDTVVRMVDRGATFTVTAEIELQMGYGDPLTGILHAQNAPISIGTDVEPAVGSDLFTCMRLTLQHERNRSIVEALAKTNNRPQHSALTCRNALSWVTTGAAKIAGLDDRIGSITPGKQADIILLRTDALNMTPMHDLAGCAVMQAATANVDTVIIAGRVMKQGGNLLTNGLAEKIKILQRSGERILQEFNALPRRGA